MLRVSQRPTTPAPPFDATPTVPAPPMRGEAQPAAAKGPPPLPTRAEASPAVAAQAAPMREDGTAAPAAQRRPRRWGAMPRLGHMLVAASVLGVVATAVVAAAMARGRVETVSVAAPEAQRAVAAEPGVAAAAAPEAAPARETPPRRRTPALPLELDLPEEHLDAPAPEEAEQPAGAADMIDEATIAFHRLLPHLEARDVQPVVRRQHPRLEQCYSRALRRTGSARPARVRLVVDISPRGHVSQATALGDDIGDLDRCLESVASRWHFPPSREGARVPIPLSFRPRS